MTAPTFSVIIAAYDAETTIGEALDSVFAQTLPPLEIVVVDDGSTDRTADVVARNGDQVRLIRQENRGPAAARNVAVRQAVGDFVAILDADDVFEPERLAAFSELAAAHPELDILMSDVYFERSGEVIGRFSEETPFAFDDQLVQIVDRCFLAEPAVRRAALLAIDGFDESMRVGEDWECWIRLLQGGAQAGYVNRPLLRYRVDGAGLTADRLVALRSRVQVIERAAALELPPDARRAVDHYLPRRRRRALLAEVETDLAERHPGARRRAAAAALGPEIPLRVRGLLLLSAAVPQASRLIGALDGRRRG